MTGYELNMDGLVGPTHHYAGLSQGNVASVSHALTVANPMQAALQGLQKMRFLHRMGIKQAVIPPHQRPNLVLLSHLGFTGTIESQLKQAKKYAPELLSACFSASSMWTANMATIAPSIDTSNNRVHFTAANLIHNIHRSQEADFSSQLLKKIFSNETYFEHHPPLFKANTLGDEGAANHNRLCQTHSHRGIHLFIYGKRTLPTNQRFAAPTRFPARQTLEASEAIARCHQLNPQNVFFAQQNPVAIDEGVFHNDVIAVTNESILLLHEDAFLHQNRVLDALQQRADFPINIIEVKRNQVSLQEAVKSYLFNSQLLTLSNHKMILIAPHECEQQANIKSLIDVIIKDSSNPISEVHYLNLKQSMQNGGGPACLRLRVMLNENELINMHQGIIMNDNRLDQLEAWVKRHYRTTLHADDLVDPALIQECHIALDELTKILDLGNIYPFQQN